MKNSYKKAIRFYKIKNISNILCEDLFVVKDGEITSVLEFRNISNELLKREKV